MPAMAHAVGLFRPMEGDRVRCLACARYCVVPRGSHGFCFVRKNVGGHLVLLSYGKASAVQVDPIEKKPLSHFHPGARVYSIGTVGCNWRCQYCQNADISQEHQVVGRDLPPRTAVREAISLGCQGVTFTYNEPTIFLEYALDVIQEAHAAGLFSTFVTNGYMTPEAVEALDGHLDAVSIDFKGSGETGFLRKYVSARDDAPILATMEALGRRGVHVEVTNLIVPQVGDSPEALRRLAQEVRDRLGRDTPFHLLRFHPDYRMMDLPVTPTSTLERLHAIAREEGLRYVYLGNVWGHPLEHTYCALCGALAVERYGFTIRSWNLDAQNRCLSCGERIPIVGAPPPRYRPQSPTPVVL